MSGVLLEGLALVLLQLLVEGHLHQQLGEEPARLGAAVVPAAPCRRQAVELCRKIYTNVKRLVRIW